jgi:hypothetical protein
MRFNDYYQIVNLTIEGAGETLSGVVSTCDAAHFTLFKLRKLAPGLPSWLLGLEGIRKCVPLVASSASLMLRFFPLH